MKKIIGKRIGTIIPKELWNRIEKQRKKERLSLADFLRRVLDRYLTEQEFRGDYKSAEAKQATEESIKTNRELLEKLRNS